MAVTRINNNQISDAISGNIYVGVNAAVKLQNYSVTATKIANNLTYGSDLTITGNLTVQGNTTTIDTTYTTIEDPILLLASNQTGSPSVDIGFVGERGTSNNIAFVWDESAGEFITAFTNSAETNTTINIIGYASLKTLDTTVTGNLSTAGYVTVTGNITGGNLNSNAQIVATGNITGGNLSAGAGIISTTGNVDTGNVNATGNINGGQLYITGNGLIGGTFTSTSNIVANVSGIFFGAVPTGNLAIQAGVTGFTSLGSNVVAQFSGNTNSYSQINFENINSGTLASTDYIATADNGNDSSFFANWGITSSTHDDPAFFGDNATKNDAYLYVVANGITSGSTERGNLIVGSTNGNIKFFIGNTAQANVIQTISTTGIAVTGTITASGNVSGGNVNTAGVVNATGNLIGGNVNTAGQVVATGNVTGGNLVTGGRVVATGNIVSSSNIAGGNLAVTGTITSATIETTGNVLVGGNLTVQGNIQYINVDDLRVEDPIIIMGTGPNGAPLTTDDGMDRGIYMEWYKTGLGNSWIGWENSSGNLVAAVDVNFSGNNVVNVNAYGTFQAGNIYAQSALVDGNVTGGNLITAGLGSFGTTVSVTGNITSGNVISNAQVVATGNITGGNLVTAGLASVTGNVIGGNLVTAGQVVATGNVTGGNINTAGLGSFGTTVTATGNITGGNIITAGLGSFGTTVTATGNITGGNLITGAQVVATGNVTGGNINTAGQVVATGNITGGNITTAGTGTFGNITISDSNVNSTAGRITINSADADVDFAVDGDTTANVFYVDAGTGTVSIGSSTQTTNAALAINTTNSFLMPVGNTAQRPSTGVTGMLRFNSTLDAVEVYDTDSWTTVGTPNFTVVTDDQFTGNGVQTIYTLANAYTTNSVIVSINGVVQIPTTAYSVSGNALTFTEAPQQGDFIDVRGLTTTTQVTSISNSPGNAVVSTNPTVNEVNITGNLVPVANNTQSLGSQTLRWKDLYVAGNSIYIGNIVMKNTSGNTVAFYGPDGSTPATLDSTNVDTTTISNGTSNLSVVASNGNITATVGGAAIITIASSGIINNMGNGVGNIGSSTGYFNTVFAKATSAQYADLAENYTADAKYTPGTVLSFGGDAEVTLSAVHGDARIAGVVSTNPSYIMNSTLESEHVATIALTGRVPTKVTGIVHKGDMMISDGSGRAIACATPAIGTVIGKALENHNGGDAVIEVVVGRL
jgi:hypothetical protein